MSKNKIAMLYRLGIHVDHGLAMAVFI